LVLTYMFVSCRQTILLYSIDNQTNNCCFHILAAIPEGDSP
jgi:hypothetical protein